MDWKEKSAESWCEGGSRSGVYIDTGDGRAHEILEGR